MKKSYHFFAIFSLLLAFTVSVNAENRKTYQLDELDMKIDIPDELYVFTRDMPENDPSFSVINVTRSDMLSMMEAKKIYLNAIHKTDDRIAYEVVIVKTASVLNDFSQCSDTVLQAFASSLKSEYTKRNIAVSKVDTCRHKQTKFIRMDIIQSVNDITVYAIEYSTVVNHKHIIIKIQSYSGAIESSLDVRMRGVLDSIRFTDSETSGKPDIKHTESFVYVDPKTKLEFRVPADWSQKELWKKRKTIDAKFASSLEPGLSILYGSLDFWGQIPDSEKSNYLRKECNSESFSDAELRELAESFGIGSGQMTAVKYGDKRYSCITAKHNRDINGLNVEIKVTNLFRIENGYIFMFQFSGDRNNNYYKDFESLLASVKYPSTSESGNKNSSGSKAKYPSASGSGNNSSSVSAPKYEPTSSSRNYGYSVPVTDNYKPSDPGKLRRPMPSDGWTIFLVSTLFDLIITFAVYSLPICIYRYFIRKATVEPAKAWIIVFVYALIALFAMIALADILSGGKAKVGGALALWSFINYKILTKGKSKPRQNEEPLPKITETELMPQGHEPARKQPEPINNDVKMSNTVTDTLGTENKTVKSEPVAENSDDVVFCHNCGTKLRQHHQYCFKCGAKVEKSIEA